MENIYWLFKGVSKTLDNAISMFGTNLLDATKTAFQYPFNITIINDNSNEEKTPKYLLFEFNLAGIDKDEMILSFGDNDMSLKIRLFEKEEQENNKTVYEGILYKNSDFYIKFVEKMDVNNYEAKLKNGILTVLVPFSEDISEFKATIK